MARWGQGDPRWIVEERADATNVNNWHWTEKNCTPWSKTQLQALLGKQRLLDSPLGAIDLLDNVAVQGEATANNRKGKLIFFYELTVKMDWRGTTPDGQKVTGTAEIPNLSEEYEPDELEVNVSVKDSGQLGAMFRQLMVAKGTPLIQQKVAEYLVSLKKEYSKDLIKPTPSTCVKQPNMANVAANQNSSGAQQAISSKEPNKGDEIETAEIDDSLEFMCSAEDAYLVLTDLPRVQAWSQSQVEVNAREGGDWSLFGGNVHGKFLKLEPGKRIDMTWRKASWPTGHYSNATLEFHEKATCTEVVLKQTGIPASELESTKAGWRTNYWQRINSVFAYGSNFGDF